MKLWIDAVRPAPGDCFHKWAWCKAVNTAKIIIESAEKSGNEIEFIDLDHDAGDYTKDGGDYIKLLDWLEETGRNYPIHIHSINAYGAQRMREICEKNGWKIV